MIIEETGGGNGAPSPNGVVLLGTPEDFQGRSSFMLTRLLQWADLNRDDFTIAHLGEPLPSSQVIVPLGQAPLEHLGDNKRILTTRGYVRPHLGSGGYIIPTVSPEFVLRGQSRYSSAFINDIRKATELARVGLPIEFHDYTLDPLPATALLKAQEYRNLLRRDPKLPLAVDIETPYADSDESERGEDDSWTIERISFSWAPHQGMSIPYDPSYQAAIRLLLDAEGPMVTWNGDNFDNPRLKNQGFALQRPHFDAMLAWHVLHSDLPKGLGFVATFTCPWQPEWKHLSAARPAYYNAVDSDVTWRSYDVIQYDLKQVPGLWEVYDRDVIQLNPILRKMEDAGMPIDLPTRLDRAEKLTRRLIEVEAEIEQLIPIELRRYSPEEGYVREPECKDNLVQITVTSAVKRCSVCGVVNPRKPHFKSFKKPTAKRPQNPCADGSVLTALEPIVRYASLEPWKPSSKNLIAYQNYHRRLIPQQYDKKTGTRKPSMNKKAIKKCQGKYPNDPLYALILQHRELQKIAGTYIGYVEEDDNQRT